MYRYIPRLQLLSRKFFSDYIPQTTTTIRARNEESDAVKRKRLLYQSRKRGITENGLILSTFADCYLDSFTKQQLVDYDKLLNDPDNDWDIYYWITGKLTTPNCYDNHIMKLLKKHALNCNKEQRYSQPELKTQTSDT